MQGDPLEKLITIDIVLKDDRSQVVYRDKFEWDITNDLKEAETVAEAIVADQSLPERHKKEIINQIKKQLMAYVETASKKLVKYYPQFSHKFQHDQPFTNEHKEYLKRNVAQLLNENLPMIPDNYFKQPSIDLKNRSMQAIFELN